MYHLALFGDSACPYRLALYRDVDACLNDADGQPVRTSPIFPVGEKASRPVGEVLGWVGLFCPIDAYTLISRQPSSVKNQLWFSLGLAAVIRFSDSAEELMTFAKEADTEVAAYEIWHVRDGTITVEDRRIRTPEDLQCDLAPRNLSSKDHRRVIEELRLNLHEAVRCAAVYMPEQLPRFRGLVRAVDELTSELSRLEKHLGETDRTEDLTPFRQINQAISHLIQLNSALAYVISQATYGAPPILECPCLISTHSLLGVGTAYRAIVSAADYVERVFQRYSVVDVIDKTYRLTAAFDISLKLNGYDPELWRKVNIRVDHHLSEGKSEDICSKVAYFSSRLGFSESNFCVTAAVQVLHGADSARWSLMTITHELLHAHVANVLAAIFSESVSDGLTAKRFAEFHAEFKRFSDKDPQAQPTSTIQSLRFAIFNFSVRRNSAYALIKQREAALNATEPIAIKVKSPASIEVLHDFFNKSLRLLEELLVHTLDLRYFYCGDRDIYITLLWESWTTVPAVVGDLETYILRSLAASAGVEQGLCEDRFDRAVAHLKKILTALSTNSSSNGFIARALGFIQSDNCLARLRILFPPCIYICDLARVFISSGKIESAFAANDDNIEPNDAGIASYRITANDFAGAQIKNPIALLASRLRPEVGKSSADEDRRSAWLLLAVASSSKHQS